MDKQGDMDPFLFFRGARGNLAVLRINQHLNFRLKI